ncbi:MAG: hypothetical protein KM296_00115 [Brockia lithotrophica]|nr:hypothetical protein [Brockia lithotrophica]
MIADMIFFFIAAVFFVSYLAAKPLPAFLYIFSAVVIFLRGFLGEKFLHEEKNTARVFYILGAVLVFLGASAYLSSLLHVHPYFSLFILSSALVGAFFMRSLVKKSDGGIIRREETKSSNASKDLIEDIHIIIGEKIREIGR